jgi:glycosyltransferase involved in cell wall biosynthesis
MLGREDFNFPASRNLLQITEDRPDIIHCHNLHADYFDLRILPQLSQTAPVILTLHDAWLLSGHCAHSFDCERWRTGCGACPDLTIFPAIRRDSTAFNWQRKRDIFAHSKLYLATPSQWLLKRAQASMLAPAIQDARVIANGVDLGIFRPALNREELRRHLGIDRAARVVTFAANGIRHNQFKDYRMLRAAVAQLAAEWSGPPLIFFALGETGVSENIGQARLNFIPYNSSPTAIADYLQVTDVYAHAARADTFPNAVIEALACGAPVVATAVGGIPEQIETNKTGFLVAPGNATDMATCVRLLLRNDDMRRRMSVVAENVARRRFDLADQAAMYVAWYGSILESFGEGNRDARKPRGLLERGGRTI